MDYNFSFESEDILDDDTIVNDETAVDDAGDDSETVNVTPDTKETSHNEVASAGGVSLGNNQDQLEMDPVAATESYILRQFGLSREDMEEAVEETIDEAETIPNADVIEDVDPDIEATAVPTTSVNITSPTNTHIDVNAAADEVSVGTDAELSDGGDSVLEEPTDLPSNADVAAVEGLRRLWSREDDGMDDAASNDVELDVKTSDNDMNIAMSGKAITLEPNEDDDDDFGGDDDGGSDDFGGDDDDDGGSDDFGDDEGGDDEGDTGDEDEGDEGDEGASGESFYWF